jgi:hypothetical protein
MRFRDRIAIGMAGIGKEVAHRFVEKLVGR